MRKSKVVAALAILLVVFWILYLTLYHPFNAPVSNCLRCSDSVTVSIKNRRLLYMTASYSMGQFLHLWNSLASLVGICEAGWDVEIGLQASNGLKLDATPMRELQASLFCHRTNSIIPINITSFDSIGFGLTTKHRGVASAVIDQFDYFVYAEEDMIFTISHLNAYLSTVRLFESMFGKSLNQYSVGYIRYVCTY